MMMALNPKPLTTRQEEVLAYIKRHHSRLGTSPTLREIADAFDLRSLGTVHEHLTQLERKGHITRNYRMRQAIRVVPE